uniref:RING-type domain-containing protein n=1 Tax=Hyaloperonospora arabidopsidis (strain Emoy2) TaxID=559515 RepID=M4BZI5_HYAAE
MDLAIRVNVRYAAPRNSQIKDALLLFKSARWVHSIIQYIIPQLNSVSPAALHLVKALKSNPAVVRQLEDGDAAVCVVCMEVLTSPCAELPLCCHQFHERCIAPWLRTHSTCPTCRHQLPTDAYTSYSVYAINTTVVLQQSQSSLSPAELLELSASNQVIQAIVNARVRRNPASTTRVARTGSLTGDVPIIQTESPVMNASVMHHGANLPSALLPGITEPIELPVPLMRRNASRRRFRGPESVRRVDKRRRLSDSSNDFSTS